MHKSHRDLARRRPRPIAQPSKRRPLHTRQVANIAITALEKGATVYDRAGLLKWSVQGRCERPIVREIRGSRQARLGRRFRYDSWTKETGVFVSHDHEQFARRSDGPVGVTVEVTARCRKCDECLRHRAREWAMRGWSEIRASHRTWFGTITLSPEAYMRFLSQARVRDGKQGVDFETLPADEQFRCLEREIYREVQLMIKRLRKAGHAFRFLFVCEAHKSGKPHYHCLVHEVGDPIRHKVLSKAWPHGFTNWKLVDKERKVAWYVCKYLSKSAVVAVRPSVRYGREPLTACADRDVKLKPCPERSEGHGFFTSRDQNPPSHDEGFDSQKAAAPLLGLNEKESSSGQPLSGSRISNFGGTLVSGGGRLSEPPAEHDASQRQSTSVDWQSRERQFAEDEDPPF